MSLRRISVAETYIYVAKTSWARGGTERPGDKLQRFGSLERRDERFPLVSSYSNMLPSESSGMV